MKWNRDTAIELIFGHEGGFVNRPKTDKGGPTNWGITIKTLSAKLKRAATLQDVKALTKQEAWDIYANEYWKPIRGDDLPSGLDYVVMDMCVHSGPRKASSTLQEVLKASGAKNVDGTPLTVDGVIGNNTLAACRLYQGGIERLIRAYCDERMKFLKTLGGDTGFKSNGRGWTIRVTGVDPKGQWKSVPGVVGNGVRLAAAPAVVEEAVTRPNPVPQLPAAVTPEVIKEVTTKTGGAIISLETILKKPEMIGGLAANVVSILNAVAQNNVLSYAVAFAIGVGSLYIGQQFVQRIRAENV